MNHTITTTKIIWKRNDQLDTNETSFAVDLLSIGNKTIATCLGDLPAGTHQSESYSEFIVLWNNIEGPKVIYTVYTRHGDWRIGATEGARFKFDLARMLQGHMIKAALKN